MIRFIIGGLPRSGTTWLSAFLSTDNCVCLHDPSANIKLEELSKWSGGISDTGIWFFEDWCKSNTEKFVLVDRNIEDINKSLAKRNLPNVPPMLVQIFNEMKVKRFYFELLFTEEGMRELWEYIYPEKEFNLDKFNLFKDIYMSPTYMEKPNEELKKFQIS